MSDGSTKRIANKLRAEFVARSRTQFEDWAKRTGLVPHEGVGTGYPHSATVLAWAAWQASRADLPALHRVEAPELITYVNEMLATLASASYTSVADLQYAIKHAAEDLKDAFS